MHGSTSAHIYLILLKKCDGNLFIEVKKCAASCGVRAVNEPFTMGNCHLVPFAGTEMKFDTVLSPLKILCVSLFTPRFGISIPVNFDFGTDGNP